MVLFMVYTIDGNKQKWTLKIYSKNTRILCGKAGGDYRLFLYINHNIPTTIRIKIVIMAI